MSDSAKWYVVHTYSGYENAVKTSIEKFVNGRGMEDMILRIEIPMETVDGSHGVRRHQRGGAEGLPRLCAGEDGHDR